MATQVKFTAPQQKAKLLKGRCSTNFKHVRYYRNIIDAFLKLDPRQQVRNPVMFVVALGSVLTTALFIWIVIGENGEIPIRTGILAAWLWLTVLFVSFGQTLAGEHSQLRAEGLRQELREVVAKKLFSRERKGDFESTSAVSLRRGDEVLVETGDIIPADGEVIEGVALVDETTLTGKYEPTARQVDIDHNAVTGSTRIISDMLVVRIKANPGENLLDRMFNLVEETQHHSPPHQGFLKLLLTVSTIICSLAAVVWLFSFRHSPAADSLFIAAATLIALLAALCPTTAAGLLSVIDISALDRLIQHNIIPLRGQDAMGVVGKVEVLLLNKKIAIVPGYRKAVAFIPLNKANVSQLAKAARLTSLADGTPESGSIINLAEKQISASNETEDLLLKSLADAYVVPFSPETGLSGLDFNGMSIRKGTPAAVAAYLHAHGCPVPPELNAVVERITIQGGMPLVVTLNGEAIGVIHIQGLVNKYLKARLVRLRNMGIKTVMITDDPPLIAAAIAAEAGMDDFLASTTHEAKLALVQRYRARGQRVAIFGKRVDDVSILSEADLGVAANDGAHLVREAANMVDLDSNPIKLIDIVEMGHQWLATRQALTLLSLTTDVTKYFVLIPALLVTVSSTLAALNFLHLASPISAILAVIIFNALSIFTLMPLALHGLPYRLFSTARTQRNTLLVCGLGGVIAPFIAIKLIDLALASLGMY